MKEITVFTMCVCVCVCLCVCVCVCVRGLLSLTVVCAGLDEDSEGAVISPALVLRREHSV